MKGLLVLVAFLSQTLRAWPTYEPHNGVNKRDWEPQPLPLNPQEITARNLPTDHVLELTKSSRAPAFKRRQVTTVVELESETAYAAKVTIDGKDFNLYVDTGSDLTWVPGTNHTCIDLDGGSCKFGNALSVPQSEKWLAQFYQGYLDESELSGGLIKRPVSIAGISIKSQVIGLADNMKLHGGVSPSEEGLLGLGGRRTEMSWGAYPPIWESMMGGENLIQENTFSLALMGSTDVNGKREKGLLAFGGIPEAVNLTSEFGSVPMTDEYKIVVDSFRFDGADSISFNVSERAMYMDSGTTLTYVPLAVAKTLFNLFPGTPNDPCEGIPNEKCLKDSGIFKVPCDGEAPAFAIDIGGVTFPFIAQNMIATWGDHCISAVAPALDGLNLLGSSFMKNNVIVVHDFIDSQNLKMHVATYELAE